MAEKQLFSYPLFSWPQDILSSSPNEEGRSKDAGTGRGPAPACVRTLVLSGVVLSWDRTLVFPAPSSAAYKEGGL